MSFDYEDGRYQLEYKCPECKTALKQIESYLNELDGNKIEKIDFRDYSSPKCGKDTLSEDFTVSIFWD